MNFNNKRVGVIGAGAMGSAMIRGFLKAGLMQPQDMIASDLRDNALQELKRSTSINITSDNSAVVQRSQVIIFAVKPDQVENTLKEVASSITVEHLVVSVAAGISISTFERVILDFDNALLQVYLYILNPLQVLESIFHRLLAVLAAHTRYLEGHLPWLVKSPSTVTAHLLHLTLIELGPLPFFRLLLYCRGEKRRYPGGRWYIVCLYRCSPL
jgi:hypothetical protein